MATIKSIEEKARAYDEAIERAKEMIKAMTNIGGVAKVDDIQYLFPELKENEDEKIRNWIIAYLENRVMNTSITDEKDNCLNAIKWLEKQGEHKLIDTYDVCDTCDEQAGCINPCPMKLVEQKSDNWIQELEDILANATPKQLAEWKEKYFKEEPAWSENVELTDFESALFSAFSYAWQEYLSGKEVNVAKWAREHSAELLEVAREQKPACAWSEEDDKKAERIIRLLREAYDINCINGSINWLKSLKDRVQPQSKQEWSEEDEEMYKEVLTDIIYAKNDLKAKECHGLSKRAMEAFIWFSNRYKSLRPQKLWISIDKKVYVKEPVLAQKKDKSDPFGGFVVCCDHTLTPNVYERYMILGNIMDE